MPPQPESQITITDGSLDWSEGVNSDCVATVQTDNNPNGLKRTQVAWMNNCTNRGGGIIQRTGWNKQGVLPGLGLYQGQFIYRPNTGDPYLIVVIGGNVLKVPLDNVPGTVNLSQQFNAYMPAKLERVFFCQGEEFLIIQAGDGVTLPLFWDDRTLRRSRGLLQDASLNSTAPPAFDVTLQNINAFPTHVFPAQSSADNPLGVPYDTFTAPAIGATVVVTLEAAFAGNVGDTITFTVNGTGTMSLLSISGGGSSWTYTYRNNSIPAGIQVGPQYAPGPSPGLGANFPAFTAPAIGANVTFNFSAVLFNPGLVNTFTYSNDYSFRVTAVTNGNTATQANVSEIPSAGPMTYYMGRLWYAQGNVYAAGDIVGGAYGTTEYGLRDSILKVTENPLCLGGDGFSVPTNSGDIRGLAFASNLNSQLGEGALYIGTHDTVYRLTVPVTRTDWIDADTQNMPLQVVALESNGWVSDRSIVAVNGDLFYQSMEPAIRSLTTAIRDFEQWGNVPISINEDRILKFNDRSLLRFSSGIYFSNRLLMTALPIVVPVGVAHQAVIPLNFDTISSFEKRLPPCWEGMWQGNPILELSMIDYGGRERAFASAWSDTEQQIQLWEITDSEKWENNGESRVSWYVEFPAFTWSREFDLKKLVSAELWIDSLLGEVMFKMEYRPDGDPCWYPWQVWTLCSAKDSCENVHNPICTYPRPMCPSYRQTITLPNPPRACEAVMDRPANVGYQFQCKLSVLGYCRIRGLLLHAEPVQRKLYDRMVC